MKTYASVYQKDPKFPSPKKKKKIFEITASSTPGMELTRVGLVS
jgi:hypothetical protein